MAWAQEMKNLVADIKASHRDRTQYVQDVKGTTQELITRFRRELKEMARDLKDFLAKSEETREKDFATFYKAIQDRVKAVKEDTAKLMKDIRARIRDIKEDTANLMKAIRARIKDIKGDTVKLLAQYDKEMKELAADLKEFLKKSEATRMADFKGMMEDINSDIDAIRKAVGTMLAGYQAERKEAAGYWAKLGPRVAEETAPAGEAAPKAEGKRRRKKE